MKISPYVIIGILALLIIGALVFVTPPPKVSNVSEMVPTITIVPTTIPTVTLTTVIPTATPTTVPTIMSSNIQQMQVVGVTPTPKPTTTWDSDWNDSSGPSTGGGGGWIPPAVTTVPTVTPSPTMTPPPTVPPNPTPTKVVSPGRIDNPVPLF